ncbi:protein CHROMATIN REMODELING 20 [Diospyros lotus]|uniref:protein CHROMATIN REMODELING 20 n=1 Tax=Diospyros lotus TaxID=55363 RepID=UPI0022578598|nr:protein CHROMATIN REMODELING 20 [Diospyros lotus]XP_052191419.1 protein CHROMATIN REMODELING 20 [Diospyros lotus]XP_052191497.1 protein CHROMATIN REMODELING 20 [Diospyros lotus]
MEENHEEVDDVESASSDPSTSDFDDNGPSISSEDDGLHHEAHLTEEEIEELIAELLQVEGKAAEAQESLEDESLAKVETEVRQELAQSLHGDDLEKAVADEMATFREEWEAVLDELETESAHLLEQLDGAGVELPSLYKWIESQAPDGCSTEAWKKRTHWVGYQVTSDVSDCVLHAEKYLETHRPVRRRHGKVLEEGASGYLGKKLSADGGGEAIIENSDADWCSFNKLVSGRASENSTAFGSKNWSTVYLASTPQQAAELGLKFPGVDEVEEIDDIDVNSSDPFVADAIANERELSLSETQKKNFRKVKEEDDANIDRKLQLRLKHRRQQNKFKQEAVQGEISSVDKLMEENLDSLLPLDIHSNAVLVEETDGGSKSAVKNNKTDIECHDLRDNVDERTSVSNDTSLVSSESSLPDHIETSGSKRSHDSVELDINNKKARIVTIDSDDEACGLEEKSPSCDVPVMENKFVLQSEQDNSVCPNSMPSQSLGENFHCTACDNVAAEVQSHPLLNVIVCRDCKHLVEVKMHAKDLDCSECYCAWCGGNKDLISCRSCELLFCVACMRRNFGEACLLKAKVSGWECCCCSPSILQPLTTQLEKALGSVDSPSSSSDSDSDNSDGDISVSISSRRKRKKKIRRILDDAELGEETKRKIAIEKERQERLKCLEAQFSRKSVLMSSTISDGNLSEGASVEVLGDALTGYIVNVVREKGEEAVRIPPSISAKLKAHQITGIRFMWENIIQSITKVKSGDKGLGCILAHTMGLGKTFQVIAFLYSAMRSVDLGLRTALIVTPVSVLHNWRQEFMKWRPSELKPIRVFMLEDVSRERRADLLAKWRSKGGVFLIGYTAFRNLSLGKHAKDRQMARDISYALQDGPDILVCDEAHMIKNTRADVTQALKQVKCQRRIALTGSPLQNNLMEYYCMVDFVREGFLGSSHEFRNRFQNPIENGQHTNSTLEDVKIMNQRSHILYEQLKGFVQRMDMNVVKKDLPPKTVFVIAVKLSPLQRKLYKRFLDVHGFTTEVTSEKIRKRCFFAGYQALAQIWNHPGILQLMREDKEYVKREDAIENFLVEDSSSDENVDCNMITGGKTRNNNEIPQRKNDNAFFREDWWNDLLQENNYKEVNNSGKMVLLLDILTMSSNAGDKALVFSQSLSTLNLIEHYLSKLPRQGKKVKCWRKGKDWYRLDGRTEGSERQKLVERFNDPSNKRVKCTLISTRAGSLGINLHAANRVIIVDGSWNPTYDLQAIYRVWRYGQTKPVFAYRLMAHGTMEEKIYKRQVTKEGLAARVVDRQQVHRTISKEEMLHLFDFGDDENLDSLPEHGEDNGHATKQSMAGEIGNYLKQKLHLPPGSFFSDKLMENLLGSHYPRWIANYHEHETLLQENEEEKLSKEEQDMAWEVYRRTVEWEEVQQRVPLDESAPECKPAVPNVPTAAPEKSRPSLPRGSLRYRLVQRKCTNLSHLLTLRSQGTKVGSSTVCGECAREICWEDLNRDGKTVR